MAHKFKTVDYEQSGQHGSRVHADAAKSKAVSYGRLLQLEARLQQEVEELLALGEQTNATELPPGLAIETEVAFRQARLVNLAEAKTILEARAVERYQAELAEYEIKLAGTGRKSTREGVQAARTRTPAAPADRATG